MLILNNCEICNKEYKHSKKHKSKYCSSKCRTFACNQRKIKGEKGIDYVICEICGHKFKEINNDHLKNHNLTCEEYDNSYHTTRTSDLTRRKKNTLSDIMSTELSKKLSKSHTIEGYIDKYGEIEGKIRFENRKLNMSYCKTLEYYVDKHGDSGYIIYNNIQKKKSINLENLKNKYSDSEALKIYNEWKYKQKIKNTLSHYIKLYGEEEGQKRWFDKNNKISISNSKILEEDKTGFKSYLQEVDKFTRISLALNEIEKINLRGLEYGYDLDHIVSKVDGFKNNIKPEIIGHVSNIRIIESSINRSKRQNSDKDINEIVLEFKQDIEYRYIVNEYYNNLNS